MLKIQSVYFLPPLAIARLGASTTPLDCFVWQTDKSIHGGNRTVIRPATSFRVMANGSVSPFVPRAIQFRDGGLLRPVAPFFELWANVEENGKCESRQLTAGLLEDVGVDIDSVEYTITVANRKAQRRTLSAACAYIARASARGDDHERKPLLAISPHNPGQEPLVTRDHPIPLGHFQVIRPIRRKAMGVDLSALRVRFTPAAGQVYGPPRAITGPASPLPPGESLNPVTLGGRLHDIVPPENRILNPCTEWSEYAMDVLGQEDPQPSDSYDGANVGDNVSWGVIDDSCDGIIEAQVVINGIRHVAKTRVMSSCPDFAPDRRPLNSFADDLADRDNVPVDVDSSEDAIKLTQAEIADLFERAFETASLINLDSNRYRAINENDSSDPDKPQVNKDSMTGKDKPPADLTADLFPNGAPKAGGNSLPYTDAAHFKHGELCDVETLFDFLKKNADKMPRLIRPPFGRVKQLPKSAKSKPSPGFRDPRVDRDLLHDMRMPPYMRDSDARPLSITVRQYVALMKFVKLPADSPVRRHIKEFVQRRK